MSRQVGKPPPISAPGPGNKLGKRHARGGQKRDLSHDDKWTEHEPSVERTKAGAEYDTHLVNKA